MIRVECTYVRRRCVRQLLQFSRGGAYSSMWKWLMKFLGLELTHEEKMLLEALNKKQKHLDKYGGKMIITKGGGCRYEFPSREQETAYWKEVISEIKSSL